MNAKRLKCHRARPAHARLWFAAAVALSISACSSRTKPPADLVVASYSPSETSSHSEPLQLQFDQPVVADGKVGQLLEQAPVGIEPAVEVTSHWLDRQTLIITPQENMKPSTRYQVALTGELGKRTGGFSFSFVHQPLTVDGIWGPNLDQLPDQPTLPLHFNQEVRVKDVLERCHIQAEGEDETIALEAAEGAQDGDKIPVTPAQTLDKDRDYQLTCEELVGKGGDTPMAAAYVQPLHTHASFSVQTSAPSGYDVPADDVEIEIQFSTPVDLEELRQRIQAEPAITGIDQGWLDRSGTRYKVVATLKTQTAYTITLPGGVVDTFGQALEKPFTLRFSTGNARPRLSVETGIYALEPQSPGYPVWTRNVADFDVECAAVPKSKIVDLLTSSLDYDPWYNAAGAGELEWQELGLRKRDKRVTIEQPKNKWHLTNLAMHEVCGSNTERGLYLADLRSRHVEPDEDRPWRYRPHRRVLANVTDFGILLKAGTASGLVWVAAISTGEPVAGASVTLYTPQGRQAFRGRTDKDGILRIPGTTQLLRQPGADDKDEFEDYGYNDYYSRRSQRLIAVVEKGSDLGVVDGNWANGIQTWNFGVRTDRRSGETRIRGFIQSDRGIYRPGETVHFKGLVREIAVGKAPRIPARKQVAIHVEDSRGQTVHDEKTRLSRFGGFAFDLPLTEEASLGDYHVSATIQGQTFRERFSVEEFRKVSFEVGLTGTERHGRLGDKLSFEVDADYLFGAPVADATVEWTVQRRGHNIYFPDFARYDFGDDGAHGSIYDYDPYDSGRYLSYVSDGEGQTDALGNYRFSVRDARTDFDGPQDYVIGVAVRDETDQVVSKRTVVTAHKSDFYLGLHTQEFVQAVDMPFAINAVAVSPTGKQVATKAKLAFIRQTYSCTYSGGYRSYRSCTSEREVELERAIDIPATGTGTERIVPKKPGEYIVRVEATDSRGNQVVSSGWLWVIGKGEAFWSGDESARMSLIASKDSYDPGETARLVPRTSMKNATALVTLERNGIMDAFVQRLDSSADGLDIPLTDVHAPNVFASVAMVTGRTGEGDRHRPRFKMGMVELEVALEGKRLDVEVTTDKDTYEPGETVTGVVRVTAGGQPVSAEVSVSVADEGVLQLIGYKTPDPMDAFYASWGQGVDASTNWNRIARLNDPAVGDPDRGGDGPGGGDDSVRSNFVSSAFWAPSLVTDERGEVHFTFTAPDNLTAFRTMAVAADAGSRFGSGERRFTLKKPLLAKPVLPRFLNTGDQAEVGVVVHNYTGQAGTATVTATAKGVRLGKDSRKVRLRKDGTARVSFPITVGKAREATFEFAVAMAGHRDALRLDVPLHRPLLIDRKTVASGVTGRDGADSVTIPVSWEPSIVANRSLVSVTVDRTGLGELEPSLRYLITYPYGCLEQTLSRFIPLTKVKDLAASLNLDELEGPKLRAFIRAGVAKVVRHQHADGHFSLWPSGQTYPHLTVYALYGLTEARRAGVDVPQEAIDRGLKAIKRWVGKEAIEPGGKGATMAMAAYVLAELGQPDTGLNDKLFAARRGLPNYGLAFLLRAMHRARARASDVATLRGEVVGAASVTGDFALVREVAAGLGYYMSSDVRTSAITLSALLEVDPKNAMIDRLVAGLKKHQRPGGGWRNTQENLYSLVALSDYARSQSAGSELVTVSINGEEEIRRRLKGSKVLVLRRYLHNYQPGEVLLETTGKVRYDVRLIEAREDPAAAPVNKGFEVTRAYLDPENDQPLTAFSTGQLVKVRVEVKGPGKSRYVAIEDPLPAGFEAVNTKLATSANVSGTRTKTSWGFTHRELRDDRALGFADYMYRDTLVMEYLARATTPGTFVAPPARAEKMYTPEEHGRSPATQVVIAR